MDFIKKMNKANDGVNDALRFGNVTEISKSYINPFFTLFFTLDNISLIPTIICQWRSKKKNKYVFKIRREIRFFLKVNCCNKNVLQLGKAA